MTKRQKHIKRIFDIIASIFGLILFGPIISFFILCTMFFFREKGVFKQKRIGYKGKVFVIFKIKSLKYSHKNPSQYGRFIRRFKIDELPQLYNVLIGDMSIVGPRPDIPGFADKLTGEDAIILTVKPGITGPASIYYKNEEQLLENQPYPNQYNFNVIWPKKIEINKAYIINYSFTKDLYYIYKTLF